jgi:hypothetical protein
MTKVGMDTDSPGNVRASIQRHPAPSSLHFPVLQHAGYDAMPIYNVTGFSQLHDDGTGGVSFTFQASCLLCTYGCLTTHVEPASLQLQNIPPAVLSLFSGLRLLSKWTQGAPQGASRRYVRLLFGISVNVMLR